MRPASGEISPLICATIVSPASEARVQIDGIDDALVHDLGELAQGFVVRGAGGHRGGRWRSPFGLSRARCCQMDSDNNSYDPVASRAGSRTGHLIA